MADQPNGKGEQLEALAAEAREVEKQIIRALSATRSAGWITAKHMHRFFDERMYERLGCESENEWLAGPDVGLSRGHVRNLLAAYRALVIERQVPMKELEGVDVRKVLVGLPALKKGKVTAKELISDARALARHDIEVRYSEGTDAPIDPNREAARVQCEHCGSWVDADKLEGSAA